MAGTRKAPLWRQAFLRALKRTGNVRASAFEAGVDPGTAYDHRAKDAGFRAKWAGAKAAYDARKKGRPSPQPSPAGGRGGKEELVLRRSKSGDKLVRAAAGRWCTRVEESFLDALEETGCVRTAAASAGLSTTAFYNRREAYPDFAARWDERVARAGVQLPGLLDAAAVASLSPAPAPGAKRRGRARMPKVSVDQAIRIKVANDRAKTKGKGLRGGERPVRREQTHEELVERFVGLMGMLKRRRAGQRLAEGWTDAGDGLLIPPGWVRDPAAPAPEEKGPEGKEPDGEAPEAGA